MAATVMGALQLTPLSNERMTRSVGAVPLSICTKMFTSTPRSAPSPNTTMRLPMVWLGPAGAKGV